MRRLLFVAAAIAALGVAAPAGAQIFLGADDRGAGVQVGPIGVGVGPGFSDQGYYDRRGYEANAYEANDCHVVRSRVVRHGHVSYRTRRICR